MRRSRRKKVKRERVRKRERRKKIMKYNNNHSVNHSRSNKATAMGCIYSTFTAAVLSVFLL